jgi:hypothetical protein
MWTNDFARRANQFFLSSPFCKNISLSPSGESPVEARPIPSREEGALAIVTNVGTGCGGRGRRRRETELQGGVSCERSPARRRRRQSPVEPFGEDGWLRTAKPCGPGTRCWCQVGGGFSNPTGFGKIFNPPMTVTRRIRRRGERGISRKAIAQGMPKCLR